MRIDSLTYLSTSLVGIQSNQNGIARLNQQIATGLRMQASKDDPISAVKAMELSERIAVRTQYAENQTKAELDLKYENVALQEMGSVLSQVRGLLLSASSSQTVPLGSAYSAQLKGAFDQLLDLVNTRNTAGEYIFGGTATNVQPFANPSTTTTPAASTFGGVAPPGPLELSATREIQIGSNQLVQVTDSLTGALSFTDAEAGVTIIDAANPAFVPATDRHDLFHNLAHAISTLAAGTTTDENMQSYIAIVDVAARKLNENEQRVAAAQTEIKGLRESSQAVLLLEKNALSDLTQIDKSAAVVELQSRQTTLEAISRAYALTSGLSLFNYLS